MIYGTAVAAEALTHALLGEFLSFIVVLFALYTVAGGIVVSGSLRGTPLVNTALLAFGTGIASIVGTTGAAMILIRPVIRANERRRHRAHVIVFFIILVANVGGALTPLGDPPLFVGFLRGVDFFWTARHLWLQTVIVAVLVLALFLRRRIGCSRRGEEIPSKPVDAEPLRVRGTINLALIALIIAAILLSAAWKPGVSFSVFGTKLELQNLARDGALIVIALAVAVAHAGRAPCRERLHLGADPRGRKTVCRDLRGDRAGARLAAGRPRGAVRLPALGGDGK